MAWEGSNRLARLPSDWHARRLRVLERDSYRCCIRYPDRCVGRASEVDHIRAGDDHRLDNLRAACAPCHKKKSSAEGNAAQARKRALLKRPKPWDRHPGGRAKQ